MLLTAQVRYGLDMSFSPYLPTLLFKIISAYWEDVLAIGSPVSLPQRAREMPNIMFKWYGTLLSCFSLYISSNSLLGKSRELHMLPLSCRLQIFPCSSKSTKTTSNTFYIDIFPCPSSHPFEILLHVTFPLSRVICKCLQVQMQSETICENAFSWSGCWAAPLCFSPVAFIWLWISVSRKTGMVSLTKMRVF